MSKYLDTTPSAFPNVPVDVGSATTPVQENAVAVQYNSWAGKKQTAASGGSYRTSGTLGAAARFDFSGSAVTFVTARGPGYGTVNIGIDGEYVATNLDLYAPTQQWKYKINYPLANGFHTIEILPTHTKNASSSGYGVVLDAFGRILHTNGLGLEKSQPIT